MTKTILALREELKERKKWIKLLSKVGILFFAVFIVGAALQGELVSIAGITVIVIGLIIIYRKVEIIEKIVESDINL